MTAFDDQDGVVRRDQIRRAGITLAQLDAQLAARRWRALGPVVVVLHNGPLTYRQRLWAAVLNAGSVAALCARTAAAEAGLTGWESDCIEVVVPRGTTLTPLPGVAVKVHESRRFGADDIHPARRPPQTTAERSVIDAAVWTRRPRSACGLVAAAVQQRITTPDRLLAELDLAGKVRHRRLLRTALVDIGGGAQALSEIDFGRLCRRYGLPEPERQVVRIEPNGRRRYLDVLLRGPDGRTLVVEVDGAVHLLPERYWDDMSRDNELVIAGERRLRVPTIAIHLEPERVADQVRRALGLPELSGSDRAMTL